MASRARDYRQHLRSKGLEPIRIERTRKRRGDIVFVWQDGEYRAVRYGEEQAA